LNRTVSPVWKILLITYSALMIWLLFFRKGYDPTLPYMDQLKYNLTPFATITRYVEHLTWANRRDLWGSALVNLIGNVIMFLPLGWFVPKVFPRLRKFWKTLLVCAGVVIVVEVTQLIALVGTCDVDDLILNVAGICLGYPLSPISRK
jgi:glycopeptide antibiotics resistance protein